ncbi:hypothetical protein JTB14_011202 [Gonioctena quinquepunctata]|nr:hypothetical protein JTB14_011202 [Gonioctena quinquepunctata]
MQNETHIKQENDVVKEFTTEFVKIESLQLIKKEPELSDTKLIEYGYPTEARSEYDQLYIKKENPGGQSQVSDVEVPIMRNKIKSEHILKCENGVDLDIYHDKPEYFSSKETVRYLDQPAQQSCLTINEGVLNCGNDYQENISLPNENTRNYKSGIPFSVKEIEGPLGEQAERLCLTFHNNLKKMYNVEGEVALKKTAEMTGVPYATVCELVKNGVTKKDQQPERARKKKQPKS